MANKYPNTHFNKKPCRWCSEMFQPTAPSHHHCSKKCSYNTYQDKYLKRNYGISLSCYQGMLKSQDYKCKICNQEGFLMADHHKMKLVVDHCHKHGHVRGLLCHNCNRALGLLQDSVEVTTKAVEYLKEGSETIPKGSTLK